MGLSDSSNEFWTHCKIILISLLVYLTCIPIFILFLCPIYLFRIFVSSILKPIFRPSLGKIVTTRSSIWTSDSIHDNPDCNLVVVGIFEGSLNRPSMIENIQKNVIEATNSKGQLIYPEVQQFYESFCGFTFWKFEENFQLDEHMKFYEPPGKPSGHPLKDHQQDYQVDEKELIKIRTRLDRISWPKEKSPWGVLFIPNYVGQDTPNSDPKSQKCVIIFYIHHSLADGYSMVNCIMNHIGNGNQAMFEMGDIQKPEFLKKSTFSKFLEYSMIPVKGLYLIVDQFIRASDSNELRTPEGKLIKKFQTSQLPPISIDYIKQIRNHYNVSFTAVLVAGPNKICEYEGLKALDIQFSGGTLPGDTGLVFTALSYGGYIRLNTGLSFSFCKTSADVDELFRYVSEEFEILRKFGKIDDFDDEGHVTVSLD